MLHFKNDKLPDAKALLRIHDGHIDITIVWNPSDSTFERCFFSEHVFYADDPDRKKYVYDLPKILFRQIRLISEKTFEEMVLNNVFGQPVYKED